MMHNLIIDGSNTLSAAVAKNTEDYTKDGIYFGGVTTTLASISKCIQNLECTDRVFVTFDLFKSSYRKAMCKDYKSQRGNFKDPELQKRFAHRDNHTRILTQLLPNLNCNVLIKEDVEADDVIANYVKQTTHHTTIVSTDKDMLQLIDDKTSVYRPVTQEFITNENIEEYLGYPFEWFKTMKILEGDASDNICGVKGVGEKTAIKVLNESGLGKDNILKWCEEKINDTKKCPKYIEQIKLFIDQGLYNYNEMLMDLDYGPKFEILDLINESAYDLETALDIIVGTGYNKHISDWIFDNFQQLNP